MIEAHLAATVETSTGTFPVFVHTIDRPEGLVLVDTGMIDSTLELDEEWRPTPMFPRALVARVHLVINTHLHFDHCGGNRLFQGVPIHVQARELADARGQDDYTIPEWVDFDGAAYVEHDGEAEILPGVRLLPAPGHTPGHQVVLVDDAAVLGGDVGYTFRELGTGATEGQRRVLELGLPTWLAHTRRPRIPLADFGR
jgi:N-acyl homoserine lactone hydrolase